VQVKDRRLVSFDRFCPLFSLRLPNSPNEKPLVQAPGSKQFIKIVADSEEKLLKPVK